METTILNLFESYSGNEATDIVRLPVSGSARRYFRVTAGEKSYIAAYNQNIQENDLFVAFTSHFKGKGLHVPEIYCISDNRLVYIQQDLGDLMLLDVVEQDRAGNCLGDRAMDFYRKSLSELLRFQLLGGQGLDYSHCMPRPVFDRQCILWDLNYFKYCYLRLAGIDFSEQELEYDFQELADVLCREATDSFMFRDFQSRNIMVKADDVWFIDYQGGRQGALQYDVASLLYDAIVRIPDAQREELLDFYMDELGKYRVVDRIRFRAVYYRFVLVRLLQAMGAFGLRGLHEGKPHFISSVRPGLKNILSLFTAGKLQGEYPVVEEVCRKALEKTDREL